MTTFDILAIIGASAWLPQVGYFLYKVLSKPKIEFVVQPEITIINLLGTLHIAINCAFSADKKNALITKVKMQLKHERGDKREIEWIQIKEPQSKMEASVGGSVEVFRELPPTFIKVLTTHAVDYMMTFRDTEYFNQYTSLYRDLHDLMKRKADNGEITDVTKLENIFRECSKSSEYNKLEQSYKNSIYLQEGKYSVIVLVYDNSRSGPSKFEYEFKLLPNDILKLKKDTDNIYERILLNLKQNYNFEPEPKFDLNFIITNLYQT